MRIHLPFLGALIVIATGCKAPALPAHHWSAPPARVQLEKGAHATSMEFDPTGEFLLVHLTLPTGPTARIYDRNGNEQGQAIDPAGLPTAEFAERFPAFARHKVLDELAKDVLGYDWNTAVTKGVRIKAISQRDKRLANYSAELWTLEDAPKMRWSVQLPRDPAYRRAEPPHAYFFTRQKRHWVLLIFPLDAEAYLLAEKDGFLQARFFYDSAGAASGPVAFDSLGPTLAYCRNGNPQLKVIGIDPPFPVLMQTSPASPPIRPGRWEPSAIAFATADLIVVRSRRISSKKEKGPGQAIDLYRVADGQHVWGTTAANTIALSPDGAFLAVATDEGIEIGALHGAAGIE